MLHFVVGSYNSTKKYLNNLNQSFQKKNIVVHTLYLEDISEQDFEFLVPFGKNLFGESEVFIIKGCLSELNLSEVLSQYKVSDNEIFFIEEKLLKKERNILEKNSIQILDFSESSFKKNNNNIFSLADSFGKKDKKQLWLDYQNALKYSSPEEIHGVLFWQIKNLALIKYDNGKGLKPFVLKKNRLYANNFSDEEIKNLSNRFVEIFHNRKKISSLSVEIEKIILSL